MDFKIDTKDSFTAISPIIERISAKMAEALTGMCGELRQSGSKNYIVDLQHCTAMDDDALPILVQLHESVYAANESLVFTGAKGQVLSTIKKEETDLILNVAPTMKEAIDIISMEILERDLFGEE